MSRSIPLDKRVPRNPKYAGVEGRLDTGLTVDKVRTLSTKQYLKRKNEVFLRITPPQLYELFAEYEADGQEAIASRAAMGGGGSGGARGGGAMGGMAAGPLIVTHEEEELPCYERPYLILDVRPAEEFHDCHVLQARSFPAALLRQDRMLRELYDFRNREGSLIILYDASERLGEAASAASLLVERGFDNTFVLTKGLVEFADRFPSYVEGRAPEKPVPSTSRSTRSIASSRGLGGSRGGLGIGGHPPSPSSPTSRASSRYPDTARSDSASPGYSRSMAAAELSSGSRRGGGLREADVRAHSSSKYASPASRRTARDGDMASQMSEMSVAESVISRATSRKHRY